jgi:hypothetical protein
LRRQRQAGMRADPGTGHGNGGPRAAVPVPE